jgi:hypothetical protein
MHSLSDWHAAHAPREARLVLVHVSVSGLHALSPQRCASLAGVHATHDPALHTGLPAICAQSSSLARAAHAFCAQRAALAVAQSALWLHCTQLFAFVLQT